MNNIDSTRFNGLYDICSKNITYSLKIKNTSQIFPHVFKRLAPGVKLQFNTPLEIKLDPHKRSLIRTKLIFLCEYDNIYYSTDTEVNRFSDNQKKKKRKRNRANPTEGFSTKGKGGVRG